MDQWPFLINDVLLCCNPNDVWEWEKWVALWANNDDKVWFASLIRSLLLNRCRWENGSMRIPPMETSFGHWNTLLLLQDENPIIGRIFAGNPNIRLFRCLPNRDVISSLNPPNSHDQNGGTYVRIGGLLKEK